MRGAVASGKQVVADVGGNLNIESLQDTSTFKSRDQSIGGSAEWIGHHGIYAVRCRNGHHRRTRHD
nr:hemagglutinin repeat-containing protein [Cupriavidus basilensis]